MNYGCAGSRCRIKYNLANERFPSHFSVTIVRAMDFLSRLSFIDHPSLCDVAWLSYLTCREYETYAPIHSPSAANQLILVYIYCYDLCLILIILSNRRCSYKYINYFQLVKCQSDDQFITYSIVFFSLAACPHHVK